MKWVVSPPVYLWDLISLPLSLHHVPMTDRCRICIKVVFGIFGYAFRKLDIPMAPLILTVILGPMMERTLHQSLEISRGDFSSIFTRPISAVLLGLTAVFIILSLMKVASQMKEDYLA